MEYLMKIIKIIKKIVWNLTMIYERQKCVVVSRQKLRYIFVMRIFIIEE